MRALNNIDLNGNRSVINENHSMKAPEMLREIQIMIKA